MEYADNKESNKECIVENIKNIQETLKNSLEIKNNCQDLKENIEVLTLEDEMAEYMFLGLRKSAGIDICDFKDIFGKDIYSVYKEQIKDNIAKGLLWQNGTRIALTDRGIDISNTVMSDFVSVSYTHLRAHEINMRGAYRLDGGKHHAYFITLKNSVR